MSASDVAGIVLMLAATLVLLLVLRHLQVAHAHGPEWVRKLFHVSGGVLGLALPWVFVDVLPVMILGLLVGLLFVLLRAVPMLHASLGQVLHAIHRQTIVLY